MRHLGGGGAGTGIRSLGQYRDLDLFRRGFQAQVGVEFLVVSFNAGEIE